VHNKTMADIIKEKYHNSRRFKNMEAKAKAASKPGKIKTK
jgi:hypothetical protein